MHPDKAAGPDGLNPYFYQHFCSQVGADVFSSCSEWLESGVLPRPLIKTLVVLIPKCHNPDLIKDFHPISLCNVLYKIVAKVLANRIKVILPNLISSEQSDFVPNRSIVHNIVVAFETLHSMRRQTKEKQGNAALKIDISKAYDRIRWPYLKAVLCRMGFSKKWVKWIMLCVSSVTYSVLINNHHVGPIVPQRGLRQGGPLSLYLFILCAEGLSALLKKAEAQNIIHGVRVCRGAPTVSHLLFADDSFLFFKVMEDECKALKDLLKIYEIDSGQSINF